MSTTCLEPKGRAVDTVSKLVYDRREQQGAAGNSSYWLGWETGKTIDQLAKVTWKTLEFMNDAGIQVTKYIWVDMSDDNRRWNPVKQKFVDRLTGIEL